MEYREGGGYSSKCLVGAYALVLQTLTCSQSKIGDLPTNFQAKMAEL